MATSLEVPQTRSSFSTALTFFLLYHYSRRFSIFLFVIRAKEIYIIFIFLGWGLGWVDRDLGSLRYVGGVGLGWIAGKTLEVEREGCDVLL